MPNYEVLEDKVIENSRELEVIKNVDVIVAGGGPAGLAAAIASARMGAKTVLIERAAFLGGVATGSMMAAFVATNWATGIGLEIIDKLAEKGGAPKWDPKINRTATTPFDPEVLKDVTLEMALEANVDPMLYTWIAGPIVVGDKVRGIVTESKSGRQAILGKVIIDCTGDADLAVKSGAPFMKGRETDQRMRPFALLFRLGGLNVPKIVQYVKENPEELQPQYREGTLLKVGDEEVITRISGFYNLVEKAKENRELYPECHYFRLENIWVNRGTAVCNTTRVYNVNGTNTEDLTRGEIVARKQIRELVSFAKKYIPGCENAFVIDVAPYIGVRETRRIMGEYYLTDEDAYRDAKFEDAIMTLKVSLVKKPAPLNLDVHMPEPIEGSSQDLLERYPDRVPREPHEFQIPYRVLLPKNIDNLLVAGRSISVSHMIDGMTRNMVVCMRMGQVAGVTAALSVKHNVSPKNLDFSTIKEALINQRAEI